MKWETDPFALVPTLHVRPVTDSAFPGSVQEERRSHAERGNEMNEMTR